MRFDQSLLLSDYLIKACQDIWGISTSTHLTSTVYNHIFLYFLWWTYLGEVQQGVCFYSRFFLPAIFYCPVFQNKRSSQMKKCLPVNGNNDLSK